MKTNHAGFIVESVWSDIPNHFPSVVLDQFVIMPNHVHGIIGLVGAGSPRPETGGPGVWGAESQGGTISSTAPLRRIFLGQVVAYFKYRSATIVNGLFGVPREPIWQRNYYERIIRNGHELNRIRRYIDDNPANWAVDPENAL